MFTPNASDARTKREACLSSVSAAATHQEAHEVEGEHGGHAAEGQPLQHGAADAGRVTVVFVLAVAIGRAVLLTTARVAAGNRHGNDQGSEHAHCHILAENLREKREEM